jgi:hypothetical protein
MRGMILLAFFAPSSMPLAMPSAFRLRKSRWRMVPIRLSTGPRSARPTGTFFRSSTALPRSPTRAMPLFSKCFAIRPAPLSESPRVGPKMVNALETSERPNPLGADPASGPGGGGAGSFRRDTRSRAAASGSGTAMNFTATGLSRRVSRATKTWPMAPRPRSGPRRYSSNSAGGVHDSLRGRFIGGSERSRRGRAADT